MSPDEMMCQPKTLGNQLGILTSMRKLGKHRKALHKILLVINMNYEA